jgi:hypothetical protein
MGSILRRRAQAIRQGFVAYRRMQVAQVFADGLPRLVAENPIKGRVGPKDGAIFVKTNPIAHGRQKPFEAAFAFGKARPYPRGTLD